MLLQHLMSFKKLYLFYGQSNYFNLVHAFIRTVFCVFGLAQICNKHSLAKMHVENNNITSYIVYPDTIITKVSDNAFIFYSVCSSRDMFNSEYDYVPQKHILHCIKSGVLSYNTTALFFFFRLLDETNCLSGQ